VTGENSQPLSLYIVQKTKTHALLSNHLVDELLENIMEEVVRGNNGIFDDLNPEDKEDDKAEKEEVQRD